MLSVAELAVVRGVLQAYDGDKDGRLTREELERACNQLRVPVPRPSILAGLRRSAGDLAGTTTLIDSLFSAPLDGSEVSSLLDIAALYGSTKLRSPTITLFCSPRRMHASLHGR